MMYGDIDQIATLTREEKFDCVLCLNVLHLAPEPVEVLSKLRDCLSEGSTLIIQIPNMLSPRSIGAALRELSLVGFRKGYPSTGVHFSSIPSVKNWCVRSGMKIDQVSGDLDSASGSLLGRMLNAVINSVPSFVAIWFATSVVISARRVGDRYGQFALAETSRTQPKAGLAQNANH
jgi:SAM-dependent methyltransferase